MFDFLLDPFNYLFWIFIFLIIIISITFVWRPFNIYIKFAYINAKVEAIGNPFLTEKELAQLIESKNLIEFKDSLNTKRDYNINGNNSNEIHSSLEQNYFKTLDQSKADSSKKFYELFNIIFEKNDIYHVKKILKNKLNNKNIDEIEKEKIYLKKINNLIENILDSEIDKIPDILIKFGFDEEIKSIYNPNKIDYVLLDNIFDTYIINKLKNLKLPSKCQDAKQDFVFRMIDIKNLKNILRAKNLQYDEIICNKLFLGEGHEISKWKFKELSQMTDIYQIIAGLEGTSYYNFLKDSIEIYNKEKSTQIFEKLLDELYLKNLKEISIQNYTHIGPLLRFLISKEYEIMNLKIISKGVDEKINSKIITELLVMEKN